ncbi:MAG: hypothetical protein IJV00_06780, partial [Clostridia bacterium]|nr:hypothetical protein [Clostridia bacterium]
LSAEGHDALYRVFFADALYRLRGGVRIDMLSAVFGIAVRAVPAFSRAGESDGELYPVKIFQIPVHFPPSPYPF